MSDSTVENENHASATDHLANERTFLAWIRTSIAIMGFGFVVVKFSIFIRQISLGIGSTIPLPNKAYSSTIGILLVIIGAVMAFLSYIRYRNIQKHLMKGSFFPSFVISLLLTISIVFVSILLFLYLLPNL